MRCSVSGIFSPGFSTLRTVDMAASSAGGVIEAIGACQTAAGK
jgi:hypothetical protein